MLSVFLVDDEELIREGLKRLIDWEAYGFRISGEAEDGEEALRLINHSNTDIVVTDLKMPFMDGLELTEKLKERLPGIRVIVLTGFDDFPFLQQSIRNGVVDYLLKPVGEEELIGSLINIKKMIEKSQYPYPFELETGILQSITRNDMQCTENLIAKLFDDLLVNKVNVVLACRMLHSLMDAVSKRLDSEGISMKSVVGEDITVEGYFAQFEDLALIREKVIWVVSKIFNFKKGESDERVIDKIKGYIEKHYNENITLEILAGKFYLNPSYVSQLFKSETNENYNDYLSIVRINKAKKLLTESNLSIQQISEMVGYANSKYFSQIFRKYTGKQPSQYRQGINTI